MTTTSLHGNNRLIRKTIIKMLPANFAANLTVSIALMVDTLLAGALLGQQAIAAVAIGLPAIGIFQALTQTVISGANVKLAVYAGRGDQKKLNQTYSLGLAATVMLGLLFMAIGLTMASFFTNLFGGARNPAVAGQATLYLRATTMCILMGSLNTFLCNVLSLYGYQKYVFRSALIAMIGNIVFSILYIRLLPDHLAIAGLGMGTWTGGSMACIASFLTIRKKKIPLRFCRKDLNLKSLPEIVKLGFPTSANKLADSLVAGIINNLIVAAFAGDTTALSVYTAVKGVASFNDTSFHAAKSASAPLMGILYGSRDKNGLLRTLKEGIKVGFCTFLVWGSIMLLSLPLLAKFYGMTGNAYFRTGVLFSITCTPLWLVVHMFTQAFESTEKTGVGLLYSSVPDSVIYPIMLALLLPSLKYNAIWVAFNLNAIPLLLILYLIRSIRHKSTKLSMDRILFLDESIRDNVPMLDLSIHSSNTDVTFISSRVHAFLKEQNASERTAYMAALCLEELAADFVAHTLAEDTKGGERDIMDIKLFSDEDALRIVMRNASSPYNPLDFALDDSFSKVGVKLAQRVARHIDYNYVYQLNVITIDLNK